MAIVQLVTRAQFSNETIMTVLKTHSHMAHFILIVIVCQYSAILAVFFFLTHHPFLFRGQ